MVAIALIAAIPLANTRAATPPSSAARFSSSRARVGFETREYSYPLCSPDPLLHVGRGRIDGNRHRSGQGIGFLSGVNGARGETEVL